MNKQCSICQDIEPVIKAYSQHMKKHGQPELDTEWEEELHRLTLFHGKHEISHLFNLRLLEAFIAKEKAKSYDEGYRDGCREQEEFVLEKLTEK